MASLEEKKVGDLLFKTNLNSLCKWSNLVLAGKQTMLRD